MFIAVEGGNYWSAEEKFVKEFRDEVKSRGSSLSLVKNPEEFLEYMSSEHTYVNFLFAEGILSLIDCRSSMAKENRDAAYWFSEHRKVENEHVVLSDIFEVPFIDLRIRRLITHRIRVLDAKGDVRYRVVSLHIGRVVVGKLGEGTILEAIKESDRPLTPEEIEQQNKAYEQAVVDDE